MASKISAKINTISVDWIVVMNDERVQEVKEQLAVPDGALTFFVQSNRDREMFEEDQAQCVRAIKAEGINWNAVKAVIEIQYN